MLQLLGPWGEFVAPALMPATTVIYGIMLVGTDESKQENNNSFYSEYELTGLDADQAYDW